MTYTVAEMAKILNLTKANVAYRLGKLSLKEPHYGPLLCRRGRTGR